MPGTRCRLFFYSDGSWVPQTLLLVVIASMALATGGCSDTDPPPYLDAAVVAEAGAPDGPGKLDAKPDGKAPKPDGKAPKPDGKAPKPDITAPKPDITAPKPDAMTTGCGKAQMPYSGKLCGPASKPCKLKRNELLPTPAKGRTNGPAIALDAKGTPHILFSNNISGYNGFFGRRKGTNSWSVTAGPGSIASSAFERAPGGDLYGLLYAGAGAGGALWRYNSTGWKLVEQVSGSVAGLSKGMAGWTQGMAIDASGCIHTVMQDFYSSQAYLRKNKTWTAKATAKGGANRTPLVLSPSGQPHLAYWASSGSSWWVHLERPPLPVETVASYGSNMLSDKIIVHVVSKTAGKPEMPHLFFQRLTPGTSGKELVHATRKGTGWAITPIIKDGKNTCNLACVVGKSCSYDHSTYWPLAAVASGNGDVRLLFARRRYHGTVTAVYDPTNPYSQCKWQGGQVTGYVMVAWPSGGAIKTASVAQGIAAKQKSSFEAELDKSGNIHFGVYAYASSSAGNTQVRYVMLGP